MEKITPGKLIELLAKPEINEEAKKDILRIFISQIRKQTKEKIEISEWKRQKELTSSYQSYLSDLQNEAQQLKDKLRDFIKLQLEIDQPAISKQEVIFYKSLKNLNTTILEAVKIIIENGKTFHAGQDQQEVCLPPMREK